MPSPLDPLLDPQNSESAESALQQLTAELLGGTRDRASYRQAVADLARARLGCALVTLWAIEDSRELHCVTGSGVHPELIDHRIALEALSDLLSEIARHKVFQWSSSETGGSSAALQVQQLAGAQASALLVIGATLNGRLIGFICAAEYAGQRQWSGAEQATLKRMAVQLAACVSRLQAAKSDLEYESF